MSKPKAKGPALITHEAFIQRVHAIVSRLPSLTDADRKALAHIKLTYGTGSESGLRGVTWFDKWDCGCDAHGKRLKGRKPVIGHLVCLVATGQESVCQLIGTTLHELAHAIAGPGAGHGPEWKAACERVGLPAAVNGTAYDWDKFAPDLVPVLKAIPVPTDGMPRSITQVVAGLRARGAPLPPGLASGPLPAAPKLRPCGAGFGTRGGTSRGKGSGSRYLKYTAKHKAPCSLPATIRCPGTALKVKCAVCEAPYELDETSLPPSHGMGASGQGVPAKTARKHGARKPLAKRKPKPRALAKAAKAMAKAQAQAPLEPKAPDRVLGTVGGSAVIAKPASGFCETCEQPKGQCAGHNKED